MPFSHNGLKTTKGIQVFSQVNRYTMSYRFLYGNVQGRVFAKNRPVSLNWTDYISYLRRTNSKVRIKYLAKRHNVVPPVSTRSLIEHFTCSSVLDPPMAGVFLVTGMKILGRVGTHIFFFFFIFFFNFMHFEWHFAFPNA